MATYKVLFWKDIPSVIEAEDADDDVKIHMGVRFDQLIDAKAMDDGLVGSDEFLEHWTYGEEIERPGSAQEVAEAVKKEYEEKFL